MKRNYHIEFSSSAKSANPLVKLLVGIIALAAIPFIFVAFTGLIAFLLVAFVGIAAAAAVFFKFLAPVTKERSVIEEVEYEVVNETAVAMATSSQPKLGQIESTGRRKPVVIEPEP